MIGASKVRPRVDDIFKRDEKMGIYFKLYNFGAGREDPQAERRRSQYEVVKNGTNEKIFDFSEDVAEIPGASASQVTIEKLLPLKGPGAGTIHVASEDYG